jgi:cytochrome c553
MDKAIYYTHLVSVGIFLVIYLAKTILIFTNIDKLRSFSKGVKVPEMIVSFLFLATGIYMLTQLPSVNMLMWIKIICVLAAIPIAIIGYKKLNKGLALLSFLLLVGAYGLAEMSHKKMMSGGTENAASGNAMSGKDIYMNNCTKCHGDDGTAGIMGAADLSKTNMDDALMMTTIKEGKGQMSGFAGALTDEQVKSVIEFVHSLKK